MPSRLIAPARRLVPTAVALAAAACASGGRPGSGHARSRGVVAVPVVDTGGDPTTGSARVTRRPAAAAGAYRVTIETPEGATPVGAVRWLEAIVTDADGRRAPDVAVLWSSSDTTVLTVPRVSRALAPATGRADGRAVVTARVGEATASAELEVGRPAPVSSAVAPLGSGGGAGQVRIEPARVEARVGDEVTLRAVAVGARGDTLRDCPLRWSASGAPAATPGGAPPGGATAVYRVLAAGPVLVTATCRGAKGTAVIVVR